MCEFFSAISDGNGKVLFFTLDQIHEIQKQGNKKSYDWNSHTSIAHFNGILGENEDKWNKWEYDCEKKKLKIDGDLNAKDDRKQVKKEIEKYLSDNNAIYVLKVYKNNSGNRNSGDRNSGDRNSGNRNSGDSNSGYWNSGDSNSGYSNSGNRNSGYWNSGDSNSGDSNSGYWNSGDSNSGNLNTNSPKLRIFNKETDETNINYPDYFHFDLNIWVNVKEMTTKEKKENYWYKTMGGYLKRLSYKEAWIESFNKATNADVKKTLKLPNFDYNLFEEISGITKRMIDNRLK